MAKEIPWKTLSEAYAFIGNSLLKPMTMTSTVGLDPAFWEAFPSFDDEAVAEAVAACARYAATASARKQAKTSLSARPSNIRSCSWARRRPRLLHGRRCTAART